MMRPLLFALLVSSTLPACTQQDSANDELAGESPADGEDGKADDNSTFTYYTVTPSGDGYDVARANRTNAMCAPGISQHTCHVDRLAVPFSDNVLVRGTIEPPVSDVSTISAGRVAVIARDASTAITAADHTATVTAADPLRHAGDDSGPDCLYQRTHADSLAIENATVSLVPGSGGSRVQIELAGFDLRGHAEYAVSCVDGAGTFRYRASKVVITTQLAVTPDGMGGFTTTLLVPSVAVTGRTIDAPGVSSTVLDVLDLDQTAELAATMIVNATLPTAVNQGLASTVLLATETWAPGNPDAGAGEGVFTLVKTTSIECVTAPCADISERRLNSGRSATIDEVDLAASGAPEAAIDQAIAAEPTDGVIVVGYRYTTSGGGKGRSATQFYTRVH